MSPENVRELPIELLGSDGNLYKAKKLSPLSIRHLRGWIKRNEIGDYVTVSMKTGISQAERIKTCAEISAREVDLSEVMRATENLDGQLFLLLMSLKRFNPKMTEEQVEDLFGSNIAEIIAQFLKESGFDVDEDAEESINKGKGEENPT
jgi:hypothetical protein